MEKKWCHPDVMVSEPKGHPPENHGPHKKKKRHIATWLALASAATAVVAAGISAQQVNVAAAQNTTAEQEQLVTLTTTIAQQLTQEQASGNQSATNQGLTTLLGPLEIQAESDASPVAVAELTADGQAAAVLISSLHGTGVAGIEYVEVANALAAGGDMAQAIIFYKDAVNAPPGDVVTRANALRNEAAIYYSLGQNATAHQDMMHAARLFTGHVVLAQSLIERSIAQAYLADTYYQILIKGCRVALADVQAAAKALGGLGLNSSNDASLMALAAEDATAVEALRSSGGCEAAAHASRDYGAWAWSQGDMPKSIASGLGDTQAQAKTAAVQACETAAGGSARFGGCTAHVWFENAYSSFAYASNGSWGYGLAKTSAEADSVALSECKQADGTDCAIAGRAHTPNPTSPYGAEILSARG
jgi:tetratricopeptide (TPR) repeat protein